MRAIGTPLVAVITVQTLADSHAVHEASIETGLGWLVTESRNTYTRHHSQHSASASVCACDVLFVLLVQCRNTVSQSVYAVMDNVPTLWVDIRVIHSFTCDMFNVCISVLNTGAELITIEKHMQERVAQVFYVIFGNVLQKACKTASTCFKAL